MSNVATLQEIFEGNPFEIVDSPWGHIERWRASTLATGTMGTLQDVYDLVRADSTAAMARADASKARDALIQDLCARVEEFERRFDNLTARLAQAEAERRADQAREAEFEEEPLELPPDLDRLQDLPPAKIGDEEHQPSGHLHTLAAKSEEPSEALAEDEEPPSELPEPPLETEPDDMGGVALSYKKVPTSYVHAEDQVEFAIPEPGMTTDARRSRKPKGSVVPQPISVSLNEG